MNADLTIAYRRVNDRANAAAGYDRGDVAVVNDDNMSLMLAGTDLAHEDLADIGQREAFKAMIAMVQSDIPVMVALESAYIEGILVGLELSKIREEQHGTDGCR